MFDNEKIFKRSKVTLEQQNARRRSPGTRVTPKLTEEEKAGIIKRMRRFETPHSIAKLYGIRPDTVTEIMNNRKKES